MTREAAEWDRERRDTRLGSEELPALEAEWGTSTALPLPIAIQEETCLAGLDVPERL